MLSSVMLWLIVFEQFLDNNIELYDTKEYQDLATLAVSRISSFIETEI